MKKKSNEVLLREMAKRFNRKISFEESSFTDNQKLEKIEFLVGASIEGRKWPLDKFIELGNKLRNKKNIVVKYLLGPLEEKELKRLRNMNVKEEIIVIQSFIELEKMLGDIDLLVSNDTGPSHLASYLNIPVIGIMGGDTVKLFSPWSQNSKIVFIRDTCKNCNEICSDEYRWCIKNIEVNQVYDTITRFLLKVKESNNE